VGEDPLRVAVEHMRDLPYNASDDHLRAITLEIVATLKELLHLHPLYNEQLRSFAAFGGDFHDLSRLADMGASLTSADETALQAVLEELSVPAKCGNPCSGPSLCCMPSAPVARRTLAPIVELHAMV
jgi:hypothetical protein